MISEGERERLIDDVMYNFRKWKRGYGVSERSAAGRYADELAADLENFRPGLDDATIERYLIRIRALKDHMADLMFQEASGILPNRPIIFMPSTT